MSQLSTSGFGDNARDCACLETQAMENEGCPNYDWEGHWQREEAHVEILMEELRKQESS